MYLDGQQTTHCLEDVLPEFVRGECLDKLSDLRFILLPMRPSGGEAETRNILPYDANCCFPGGDHAWNPTMTPFSSNAP